MYTYNAKYMNIYKVYNIYIYYVCMYAYSILSIKVYIVT